MSESVDKIEVDEVNKVESVDGCGNWNLRRWKSDNGAIVSEFLTESSLHGLKYIAQSKRHIVERGFWILAFIVGVAAAGFLIYEVFERYEETPVVVSFQSKEQSVDTIPFPAVTICYNNQFTKKTVESLKRRRDGFKEGELEYDEITEKLELINSICQSRTSLSAARAAAAVRYGAPRRDYYYFKNQSQLQEKIIDLLLEFTPSCEQMIPYIMLDGGNIYEESHLFTPVITEHGKCCTFNMLPVPLVLKQPSVGNGNDADIFSNPVFGTNGKAWFMGEDFEDWRKWNYGEGFTLSPDHYKSRIGNDYIQLSHPFRNQRLGYSFGLSFAIKQFEPYCKKVVFRGNTFMLHNPVDTPRLSQFPSVIGANQEAFIKILPDITFADPDIKDLKIKKRQCLLENEGKLKYFSPYTQGNCFEDCAADLIEKECGCSRFFMPRSSENLICQLSDQDKEANCVRNTLSLLGNKETCGHCLPLCANIDYKFEMTSANIITWNGATLIHNEQYEESEEEEDRFMKDIYQNISIAHIFYESPSTVPKLRKRLYGITDLIANTGGILGLCLGFSVLSGAEVLYYGLMRSLWQMVSRRYLWCNTKISSEPSTSETMGLQNLAKLNYSGSDTKSKLKWSKAFSESWRRKISTLLSFKCGWCILFGSMAIGCLVFLLLVRNDDTTKKRDTFKTPSKRNRNALEYWVQATFCYANQFSMETVLKLRTIVESTTDETGRYSAERNLSMIDAMCKYKDDLETSRSSKFPPIKPDFANYTVLRGFLEENSISCSQMFSGCVYMGAVLENCNEVIKSVFTVHGKCCTVSMTPIQPDPDYDNSSDDNISNENVVSTHVNKVVFRAQDGFIPVTDPNYKIDNSSLLSRAEFNLSNFKVNLGDMYKDFYMHPPHFSVLLNLNENFYTCHNTTTSTNQILFALHPPGGFPQAHDFSSLFVANEEIVITVFPEAAYNDDPGNGMNSVHRKCESCWNYNHGLRTTKAACIDECLQETLSLNCECDLFGYEKFSYLPLEAPTCQTESNSNDSMCLVKINELVRKLEYICGRPAFSERYCNGTTYSYITKHQSIGNAAQIWASLRRFGNDTSGPIPWANNKTGIIHFTFNTSPRSLKSTNNAGEGGRLAVILIMVWSIILCISFMILKPLWRCICGLMKK